MSGIVQQIDAEIAQIEHILDSVPFMAGSEIKTHFLNTYKLTYADIKRLNITEQSWEKYDQIPVNKLLKLAVSFGNLIEAFSLEKTNTELRNTRLKAGKRPQTSDPFNEGYTATNPTQIPTYYMNLAKNIALILRNFDIGSTGPPSKSLQRHISNLSVYSKNSEMDETLTVNGLIGTTTDRITDLKKSPIRLNSRQMIIEKLEININLDAMFTMKIVLKLIIEICLILQQLWKDRELEEDELAPPNLMSSSSSVFSSASNSSEPLSSQDYTTLVRSILYHINSGIIGPFTSFLQTKVVEPRVISGFQNLLDTM